MQQRIIAQHGETRVRCGMAFLGGAEDSALQEGSRCSHPALWCAQGRVRTKTVKKASRIIIEKYYQKLTLDFDINKRVAEDVATIQTKRLRNKIAGFTTVRRGPWSSRRGPGAGL